MTPDIQKFVDQYPHTAAYFKEWQHYDLNALDELLDTMCEEQRNIDYPLFAPAPAPADKCILEFHGVSITVERRGDEYIIDSAWDNVGRQAVIVGPNEPHSLFRSVVKIGTIYNEDEQVRIHNGQRFLDTPEGRKPLPLSLPYLASNALEIMAMQRVVKSDIRSPIRAFRRRHKLDKVRFHVYHFARQKIENGRCKSTGEGGKRMFHYCSGHWRRSNSWRAQLVHGEKKVWIDGHWRGDPELGIVVKKYVAKGLIGG